VPLSDYAHWNEEAPRIWWEEEGKHAESDAEACEEEKYEAEQAFADELSDTEDEELLAMLLDTNYLQRWPRAKALIEWEIKDRKLQPKGVEGGDSHNQSH
jgi:hypothetical protein